VKNIVHVYECGCRRKDKEVRCPEHGAPYVTSGCECPACRRINDATDERCSGWMFHRKAGAK